MPDHKDNLTTDRCVTIRPLTMLQTFHSRKWQLMIALTGKNNCFHLMPQARRMNGPDVISYFLQHHGIVIRERKYCKVTSIVTHKDCFADLRSCAFNQQSHLRESHSQSIIGWTANSIHIRLPFLSTFKRCEVLTATDIYISTMNILYTIVTAIQFITQKESRMGSQGRDEQGRDGASGYFRTPSVTDSFFSFFFSNSTPVGFQY